jgi:predicted GH43/DUF377 family glycosyl hydrolase
LRITFVEPLRHHAMNYTALSPLGPRIALAESVDRFHTRRLGLGTVASYLDIDLVQVDNKDTNAVPVAAANRDDLGLPDRFEIYYGMADNRIGVARLDVPACLPPGALADPTPSRGTAISSCRRGTAASWRG